MNPRHKFYMEFMISRGHSDFLTLIVTAEITWDFHAYPRYTFYNEVERFELN